MPIEIKELHIRVTVNAGGDEGAAQKPPSRSAGPPKPGGGDKDAIVAECVEQVLEILQNKSER
ncbi:MAG: hypothetical protein HGB19_06385 [Chlorobiales bacterium]|jgi:hypothetical protein|nr:hypothetical protein [Chlorobiales bacterium]